MHDQSRRERVLFLSPRSCRKSLNAVSGIVLTADHNYDIEESLDLKRMFPNYKKTCLCWESPQAEEGVELFQNGACHTIIESENEDGVCNNNKKVVSPDLGEPVIILSLYCIHTMSYIVDHNDSMEL